MILCPLNEADHYFALNKRLPMLFDFVRSHSFLDMPLGRIELDGDNLFINNSESVLIPMELQKLEIHRRYIDVHIPLDDVETIGWSPLCDLSESEQPFNTEKDFAFYSQPAQFYTTVTPGQCFFAFPEDAHAPIIGQGVLRKAICKVLID